MMILICFDYIAKTSSEEVRMLVYSSFFASIKKKWNSSAVKQTTFQRLGTSLL